MIGTKRRSTARSLHFHRLARRISVASEEDAVGQELERRIESLSRILDQEIRERHALSEELEKLRSEFQELNQNLRSRVERAFQETETTSQQSQGSTSGIQPSVEERLVASGFTQDQLASFARLEAEDQMRQIELNDRARREGWVNSPRYYEEVQALASGGSSVRELLGDEDYDRYMFARGLPNRIAVQNVIDTSPAQEAGIQNGDIIVAYAGQKIFSTRDLTELRSSGTLGEQVTIDIIREGRRLQLTMPRGPIGVSTIPTVDDPTKPDE